MMRIKKGATGVALGVAVALAAAACGGGGGSNNAGGGSGGSGGATPSKGGTLHMVNFTPVDSWDPQRIYVGAQIQFANRIFERTLTSFPPGKTKEEQSKLIPDLATDTGTMSDGGKTWKFTLKGDAKWQDGKPVTCAQVAYGVSRTFAADQITDGPTYAIAYLDIPKNADGSSKYLGPYKKTGQALYDKAVSCSGNTITFKLSQPVTDFNQTVTFPAFGPYREDKDQAAKSKLSVFSNGPYMLQGDWTTNQGGTFVRNPNWDASKDPFRKAYPDKIVYEEGVPVETIFSRIIADSGNDTSAVTDETAPPSIQAQLQGAAKSRTVNSNSPYTDYIVPNFDSKVMKNDKARQALAMATDRQGYITALGGPSAETPTHAMINKSLKAYKEFVPFGVTSETGDPAKAKALLQQAGMTPPVPITVAYRIKGSYAQALSALKQGWDKAGFSVTLKGIQDNYYPNIRNVSNSKNYDAMWAGWGADWPSGSTVIPPLFDSRPNLSAQNSGQDYGRFKSDQVNKQIDEIAKMTDPDAREKAWGDLDETVVKMGATIPLVDEKFTFVHGSDVKNFVVNEVYSGYVELADIAVK